MNLIKRFTTPREESARNDWRKILLKRLDTALKSPVSYSLVSLEQLGRNLIPEESFIRITIEDISELEEIYRIIETSKYRNRLSYTVDELKGIFDHEREHLQKAKDLGYKPGGKVSLLFYYRNSELMVDLSFGFSFGQELQPLADMEVCLASNKPSKPDLARFMGLLLRLDRETVDSDKLYDLLRLYALKTNQEFITDIDEIYRRFRGVKKVTLGEVKLLRENSRIEVDQKAYLFLGMSPEGKLKLQDDYREYEIDPEGKTICIDRENVYISTSKIDDSLSG